MASVAEAFVTVRPDLDRFGGELKSKLGGAAKLAAGALAAVGVAAGAAAVKGLQAFSSLEQGMNEVFTLLPGITADAMGDMTEEVRDFSKEFGVLPDKVVPALYQALSAGVPKDNVFAFLETAQKAAKGGVTDLETAVDGISSVVNAYGEEVIDATRASDLMFTAVRLGKTNFEELSSSLFNVIPTAASLGVEFGDVTAALAALTAQGTPTSVATTQMRQMLIELSRAGGETAETFEKVAGKSFVEFIESGGNVQEALTLLADYADESGVRVADMFGSVEAGAAASALASEAGAQAFGSALGEMQDSAGATQAAFEQMDQGLAVVWEKLKANANDVLLELGERLAPHLEAVGERLIGVFESMGFAYDLFTATLSGDKATARVARMTGQMTGVGEVAVWLADTYATVRDRIVAAVDKVKVWWDENGPAIVAKVREVAQALVTWWTETAQPKIAAFGDALQTFWNEKAKPVWDALKRAVENNEDTLEDLWTNVERIMTAMGGLISSVLGDTSDDFDASATDMEIAFGTMIETAEGLTGVLASLLEKIEQIQSAWGTVSKIGKLITNPTAAGMRREGVRGRSWRDVVGLADGGIVTRPTLAMIGEGGESEAVIPLSKLAMVGAGGGGVTVHVHGSLIHQRELDGLVGRHMQKFDRRNGRDGNRLGL